MPSMNPQTMTWSLRLSRWKHMVVTSLSAAPLQMGSDCDRQKFLLHWLHDELEELPCARRVGFRLFLRFFISTPAISPAPASSSKKSRTLRASWSSSSWAASFVSPCSSSGSVGLLLPPPDGGWCCEGGLDEEPPPVEDLGLISMIVLFVKQVHLQNVGAAVSVNARLVRWVRLKGGSQVCGRIVRLGCMD